LRTDSHRFDRSYAYDQVGRLTAARTGAEARGETTTPDRNITPYKHDYTYNVFDNVTSRQTYTWTEAENQTHTWTNNRESTWTYDADGRLKHTPENNYDYDAAGFVFASALKDVNATYQQGDGESKAARRDIYKSQTQNGFHTFEKTEYSIYSTVLGKLLTEVKADGTKKRTFVYSDGTVIATQNATATTAQHVAWEHQDPSDASYIATLSNGGMMYLGDSQQAELDPLGSNVGTSNPNDDGNPSNLTELPGGGFGGWGDPFGSYACMVDWMMRPCSEAAQYINNGIGDFGPLDQFRIVTHPKTGKKAWGQYKNYGPGKSGWWADFDGSSSDGDIIRIGTDSVRLPYESDPNSLTSRNYGIFAHRDGKINHDPENLRDYEPDPFDDDCHRLAEKVRDVSKSLDIRTRELNPYSEGFEKWVYPWNVEKGIMERLLGAYSRKDCRTLSDEELQRARALRDAPKPRTTFQKFWDALPSIPPLPNDKQIEEWRKQGIPVTPVIPMPGRRFPIPF